MASMKYEKVCRVPYNRGVQILVKTALFEYKPASHLQKHAASLWRTVSSRKKYDIQLCNCQPLTSTR